MFKLRKLIKDLTPYNLIDKLKEILFRIVVEVEILKETGGSTEVKVDNKTILKNKEGEIQLGEDISNGDYRLDIEGLLIGKESLGLGLSKKQITLIEGEDTSSMFKDKFQIVANGRTLDLLFPKPLTTSSIVVATSVNGITADESGNIEIPSGGGIDIQGRKNWLLTDFSTKIRDLPNNDCSFIGIPAKDCEIMTIKDLIGLFWQERELQVTVFFEEEYRYMTVINAKDDNEEDFNRAWAQLEEELLSFGKEITLILSFREVS